MLLFGCCNFATGWQLARPQDLRPPSAKQPQRTQPQAGAETDLARVWICKRCYLALDDSMT